MSVGIRSAVERFADSAMAAEASDQASLQEVRRRLDQLVEGLRKTSIPREVVDTLSGCRQAVRAAIGRRTAAAARKDLTALQKLVARLQDQLSGPLEFNTEPENTEASAMASGSNNGVDQPETNSSSMPSTKAASQPKTLELNLDEEGIELLAEFLQESTDGLASADQILLAVEQSRADTEQVNGLFRIFHSIKGVSGFLELTPITTLAHTTETMLNGVRDGKVELKTSVLDLVFEATKMMRTLTENVAQALEQGHPVEIPAADLDQLLEAIGKVNSTKASTVKPSGNAAPAPAPATSSAPPKSAPSPPTPAQPAAETTLSAGAAPQKTVPQETAPLPESAAAPTAATTFSLALDEEGIVLLAEFLQESGDGLNNADQVLLKIEESGVQDDHVNNLFRIFHTIKGVAGFLELEAVTTLAHTTETLLNRVRDNQLELKGTVLDLVFEATQVMRTLAQRIGLALEQGGSVSVPPELDSLLASMRAATEGNQQSPTGAAPAMSGSQPSPPDAAKKQDTSTAGAANAGLEQEEEEPESFYLDLSEEGQLVVGEFLQESTDGLSSADQILLDVESRGVTADAINSLFRIFHTIKGLAGFLQIRAVTALAHGSESMLNRVRDGKLEIAGSVVDLLFDATSALRSLAKEVGDAADTGSMVAFPKGYRRTLRGLKAAAEGTVPPEAPPPKVSPGKKLGQILIGLGLLPPKQLERALAAQRTGGRPLGEVLVGLGVVAPKDVARALRAQRRTSPAGQAPTKIKETVKVDLERVDSLVEAIGELVIIESMVTHAPEIASIAAPHVRKYLNQLTKITRDLQDTGMRMRMVPLRGLFQKMTRMVRDLARKAGKQIKMVVVGEWTEMDRNMVEQVGDPMVHLIRNAVDHGIEPPDVREESGKPASGEIRLSAYHEGGSTVIEIRDDGRGLDRQAILDKALDKGLIREGTVLHDQEIYELIFAPGFSTAKQVTEISGRGVGMDVVRRNIEAMRGRIQISSTLGQGSVFKLVLPLTLAIIDGMQVACGVEQYIIPTLSIVESIQPEQEMLASPAGRREVINVRGEILPLLRLDQLVDAKGAKVEPTEALVVVVESLGQKIGLLVDDVVTQQQVVIKNMGASLRSVSFVSGAAILSDGRVGLILNVDELGGLIKRTTGPTDLAVGF